MVIVDEKNNNFHYTIKEMAPDERPRERLIKYGATYLSDSELIALILATGSRRSNLPVTAIDLAQQIVANYNLSELVHTSVTELEQIHGVGLAKAARLKAAIELANRITAVKSTERPLINSPESAARFLIPQLRFKVKEYFLAVLLDAKNRVIRCSEIHVGTVNASLVHPREVFREAIRHSAVSLVIAHNHPSGETTPSNEDLRVTKRLVEVGNITGIEVIDHLIIGHDTFLSFKREGIL